MGTYLSTPVVDKCEETGTDLNGHPGCAKSSLPVNWGVVDMQGWRKSMEDAHVARTNVRSPALPPGVAGEPAEDSGGDPSSGSDDPAISSTPSDEPGQITSVANDADQEPAKVFAVFDGHGGPEVARFCQLYLVDVLTSQREWNHATLVEQGASTTEEVDGAAPSSAAAGASMSNGEPQPSALGSTAPNIGKALIESFHALDRMIDDPSRRDELTLLRSEKPQPGQYKSVTEGGGRPIPGKDGGSTPCLADDAESEEDDDATDDGAGENGNIEQCAEEEKKECTEAGSTENNTAEEPSSSSSPDTDTKKKDEETGKDTPTLIEESKDSTKEDKEEGPPEADMDTASTDSDSTASVGGGDSIVNDGLDDDDVDDDNEDGEGQDGVISTADAVALFQKLLTMSGSSGTVEVEVEEGEGGDSNSADGEASKPSPVAAASDDGSGTPSQPAATTIGPNAAQPTRIQNGRQVSRSDGFCRELWSFDFSNATTNTKSNYSFSFLLF